MSEAVVWSTGSVWFLPTLSAESTQMWVSWFINELNWVVNSDEFFFFLFSLPQVWLFSKLRRFLPPENSSRQAYIRGASEGWLACPFCFPHGIKKGPCPEMFFCLTYRTRLRLTMLSLPVNPIELRVLWSVLSWQSWLYCPFAVSQAVPQVTLLASMVLIIKGHPIKWHRMTINLSRVSVS